MRIPTFLFFAGAVLTPISPVAAATFVVTNTNDSGSGSLRQAILSASQFGDDTIVFDLPGPGPHIIELGSELLPIFGNLTILNDRSGDEPVTIKRSEAPQTPAFRVFEINANSSVLIAGLTMSNGRMIGQNGGYGGAISALGSLTLRKCTLSANSGYYGGAIFTTSELILSDCTLSGNSANGVGGAIYSDVSAMVSLTNCSVVSNSTIGKSGNTGGGIRSDGPLSVVNCTFSGNSAQGSGGGIASFAALDIRNCTFSSNTSPNGNSVAVSRTTFETANSIFHQGTATGENFSAIQANVVSHGHNLSDDEAGGGSGVEPGGFLGEPGDRRNTDPRLAPLADNGGLTSTHALLSDSQAINAGDDGNAPSLDQRGYSRVGVSDIGAFEFGGLIPSTLGNISTRLRVETGDNVLIGGFIVTGTQPKKIIVRAIGPSLPLAGALADPVLELRNSSGALIRSNNDWRDDPAQESEIIATGIPPSNNLEAAIVETLPANGAAYTAIVRGANNGTGIGVVEAYDLDGTVNSELANISTRGFVQTGDDVLIGGLIVLGQSPLRVIVRGIGPSLPFSGTLADPILNLHDSNGALLISNDNWREDPRRNRKSSRREYRRRTISRQRLCEILRLAATPR